MFIVILNLSFYCHFLDEHATNSSNVEPNKYRDTPEVIHIPPKFQQIKYGLNLPEAATSVIRRTAMIQKERESNNHPQTAARRPSASMDDEHIRKSNN